MKFSLSSLTAWCMWSESGTFAQCYLVADISWSAFRTITIVLFLDLIVYQLPCYGDYMVADAGGGVGCRCWTWPFVHDLSTTFQFSVLISFQLCPEILLFCEFLTFYYLSSCARPPIPIVVKLGWTVLFHTKYLTLPHKRRYSWVGFQEDSEVIMLWWTSCVSCKLMYF